MESGSLAEEIGFMTHLPDGVHGHLLPDALQRPPAVQRGRGRGPEDGGAGGPGSDDPALAASPPPAGGRNGSRLVDAGSTDGTRLRAIRPGSALTSRADGGAADFAPPFRAFDRPQPGDRRGHGEKSPQEHLRQARHFQPAGAVLPLHPLVAPVGVDAASTRNKTESAGVDAFAASSAPVVATSKTRAKSRPC